VIVGADIQSCAGLSATNCCASRACGPSSEAGMAVSLLAKGQDERAQG
jgi:hypothetical protein